MCLDDIKLVGHLLRESYSFDLPCVLSVFRLIVILVISHFGFEGGTLVPMVLMVRLRFTLCVFILF